MSQEAYAAMNQQCECRRWFKRTTEHTQFMEWPSPLYIIAFSHPYNCLPPSTYLLHLWHLQATFLTHPETQRAYNNNNNDDDSSTHRRQSKRIPQPQLRQSPPWSWMSVSRHPRKVLAHRGDGQETAGWTATGADDAIVSRDSGRGEFEGRGSGRGLGR